MHDWEIYSKKDIKLFTQPSVKSPDELLGLSRLGAYLARCVSFVVARRAGHDKTYATSVSYFAVTHEQNPLCKLFITRTYTVNHPSVDLALSVTWQQNHQSSVTAWHFTLCSWMHTRMKSSRFQCIHCIHHQMCLVCLLLIIIKVFVKRKILSIEIILSTYTRMHVRARARAHTHTHTHTQAPAHTSILSTQDSRLLYYLIREIKT